MPPKEFIADSYGGITRIRYKGRRLYLPLSLSHKLPGIILLYIIIFIITSVTKRYYVRHTQFKNLQNLYEINLN